MPKATSVAAKTSCSSEREPALLRGVAAAGDEQRADDGADAVVGLQQRETLRPEVEDALGDDRHHREERHAEERAGEGEEGQQK